MWTGWHFSQSCRRFSACGEQGVQWEDNDAFESTFPCGHRPYSRQVTERMGCNVVIHPPPSIYPKAGNGALRDQWAIKYNCQNDSSTIAFTVCDLVHWNYVISQNIPRVCESWKSLSIYVFAAYIFLFTRHSVHWSKLPVKLRSGHRQWLSTNYRG